MIKRKQEDLRYKIDYAKKVLVYKNLHQDCWSIRQNGLVKAHSDGSPVYLYETHNKVNHEGRQKVLRDKKKNVHAFIVGYLTEPHSCYQSIEDRDLTIELTYNPYKYRSFVNAETEKPKYFASVVKLLSNKILATDF
tara:strand:+ start:576 stop:986 length:411 start_codon:yes stop_codon:yes gene_type:complete